MGADPKASSSMGNPSGDKRTSFPSTLCSSANKSKLTKAAIPGQPLPFHLVFSPSFFSFWIILPRCLAKAGVCVCLCEGTFLVPWPWGLGVVSKAWVKILRLLQPFCRGVPQSPSSPPWALLGVCPLWCPCSGWFPGANFRAMGFPVGLGSLPGAERSGAGNLKSGTVTYTHTSPVQHTRPIYTHPLHTLSGSEEIKPTPHV